jgi:hypothetical protein
LLFSIVGTITNGGCNTNGDMKSYRKLATGDTVNRAARGEVSVTGDAAGGDDGGGAWRQFESSVVCGRRRTECVTAVESSRDGVGVNDGAWCVFWVDPAHKYPSGRSHEMRGDGMGVGHVGEVSNRARSSRDAAAGDDDCDQDWKCKPRVVRGQFETERDQQRKHLVGSEPTWDRIHVADSAWDRHGRFLLYRTDSAWSHRLPGDGMGVRDVVAMPRWTWSERDPTCGDDHR